MKWILYLLASIPGIYFFITQQFAKWAYIRFECKGGLKDLEPCFIGTYDIMPHLSFGFFLAKIFWIPAVILSITLIVIIHKHYYTHNKS